MKRVGKWVVVANPGQVDERELDDFDTFSEALAYCEQHSDDQQACDLMFRLADSTLTTEY